MANVLFVCLHNAGRSQMSQALFERVAEGRHGARSAGTTPGERVHPGVVEAMNELGIDLSDRIPRELTREDAEWAAVVVTMGCGDACPYIPGRRYLDWDLEDPSGRPLEAVRAIRDDIARRVEALVEELDRRPQGVISTDDPRADDVRALLERHLDYAKANTSPEDVHALEVDALVDPAVTFFSFRAGGELLGVAALKRLDDEHAEIKSMHTAEAARDRGVGRALVDHLVAVARERGHRRVSIETGAGPAFAPARRLYASADFTPCEPFADYGPRPTAAYMTLYL